MWYLKLPKLFYPYSGKYQLCVIISQKQNCIINLESAIFDFKICPPPPPPPKKKSSGNLRSLKVENNLRELRLQKILAILAQSIMKTNS